MTNRTRISGAPRNAFPAAMMIALVAGGCGSPAGVIFEPLEVPLRWPAPPETTRVQYVGTLESDADLKPARSFAQSIGAFLFGEPSAHSMLTPYSVCTDEMNRLFVCDSNAQVVHVFDLDRRTYEQWRPEGEDRAFAQPIAAVYDHLDRLLVTDSMAGTIFAFDRDGRCLGDFGAEHLQRPCGIAVDPATNRIFVADAGAHQVIVLAIDGELLERLGERGVEPGQFNFPTNVAVDSGGRLYVADTLNFRIQVFDPQLAPIRQIGTKGDRPGYFSHPKGLALDRDDHLYVVDSHFEAVQIFDPDGQLLLAFGAEGTGPGQFWLPAGIHIDTNDRIWIADSYNRRVQVFEYRPEVP